MGTTADKLARLSETKALLKTRLTEKGVDVTSEENFYNLADKVGEIQSGSTIEMCSVNLKVSGWPPFKIELIYPFYDGETILIKEITPTRNTNNTISVVKGSYIFVSDSDAYSFGKIDGLIEKTSSISGPTKYSYCYKVNGDGTISWK